MHSKKQDRPKPRKRCMVLFSVFVLLLVMAAGTTFAYLMERTGPRENVFLPSRVACQVAEVFENNVKSQVSVQNTGDVPAYIRATVVVTWVKDDTGETSAVKPVEDRDYQISYQTLGWLYDAGTGFWYYHRPVGPSEHTGILIERCTPVGDMDGYHLSVTIVASGIQATPETVVEAQWGVAVEDGTITAVPSAIEQGGA